MSMRLSVTADFFSGSLVAFGTQLREHLVSDHSPRAE
jgi:hypothetical protein